MITASMTTTGRSLKRPGIATRSSLREPRRAGLQAAAEKWLRPVVLFPMKSVGSNHREFCREVQRTMNITEKTLRTVEREYSTWAFILNNVLGVTAFSLGISCLGTPRPDITGSLSLVFMLIVGIDCRKNFPKTLIQLRDAQLSKLDQLTRDGIRKKYLSVGAAITHAPSIWSAGCFSPPSQPGESCISRRA